MPTHKDDWWKWGDPSKSFHLNDYPGLRTYLETLWETSLTGKAPELSIGDRIEKPAFTQLELEKLFPRLKEEQLSTRVEDRAAHGMGRSYHDLIRLFSDEKLRAPDFVIYPHDQEEVVYILQVAQQQGISITTFSGGSNVTGALDVMRRNKPVGAMNMKFLNRLVSLDKTSMTATFEGGIFGPALEKTLNKQGYTLGHFPQSFEFSTLGGWAATRSAGQESGLYGKIEDMILGLKAITPAGTIENLDYPRHASGVDVHPLFIGSEGTLGVIVQVKVQIHLLPGKTEWVIGLFKDFASGAGVLRQMVQSGIHPAVTRLSDPAETKMLSLFGKGESAGLKKLLKKALMAHVKFKGYTKPAILMCRLAGSARQNELDTKEVKRLMKRGGAWLLPSSGAGTWEENRFSLPYLRDTLALHGVLIDTFETVAYWENLLTLYTGIRKALEQHSDYFQNGGLLFCHVSHVYRSGASLYFTLMARQLPGKELEQWEALKTVVCDSIVAGGGAISHHHGIGRDHRRWYLEQLPPESRKLLAAIKTHLDPNNILNPGKLYDQ